MKGKARLEVIFKLQSDQDSCPNYEFTEIQGTEQYQMTPWHSPTKTQTVENYRTDDISFPYIFIFKK